LNPYDCIYDRDFARTMFDYVLPVLGENLDSISERHEGMMRSDLSQDYYIVYDYRFHRRKGVLSLRIPVR